VCLIIAVNASFAGLSSGAPIEALARVFSPLTGIAAIAPDAASTAPLSFDETEPAQSDELAPVGEPGDPSTAAAPAIEGPIAAASPVVPDATDGATSDPATTAAVEQGLIDPTDPATFDAAMDSDSAETSSALAASSAATAGRTNPPASSAPAAAPVAQAAAPATSSAPQTTAPAPPPPPAPEPEPEPVVSTGIDPYSLAVAVHDEVNAYRVSQGLHSLSWSGQVAGVAQGWSDSMAARASLGHNPNYSVQIVGAMTKTGENVIRYPDAQNYSTYELASLIVYAWIGSPGHHRSMVDGSFTTSGVGIAFSADGDCYATQNFMG
jgi:uncharacterized protein YkwD